MSTTLKFIVGGLVVLVVLGWFISLSFEKKPKVDTEPTKLAPNFTLKDVKGREVKLTDFKGKSIYLKFWASWCRDCIKEVVPQRELEKATDTSKVVFINVSVDKDSDAWKRAVERNKLPAIELIDNTEDENSASSKYNVNEIPRFVFINKQGMIIEENAPKPSELDHDYFQKYQ